MPNPEDMGSSEETTGVARDEVDEHNEAVKRDDEDPAKGLRSDNQPAPGDS